MDRYNVLTKPYFNSNFLTFRHYRTSYEPYFSPSEGVYDLTCRSSSCTWAWESIMKTISNKERYPEPTIMASIWSPPYYMKDPVLVRLKREYETQYHYYIRNITALIKQKYDLTIEHISPANEPENVFAPWDHCNMDAAQLCRMVQDFNDSLISLCTENSYFWITQLFLNFSNDQTRCMDSCKIIATHAYSLNINFTSEDVGLAAYDLTPYKNIYGSKPVWMTEVSSTYHGSYERQMEEGLDLAMNIVNFLGTTCVERYYFWIAYTNGNSGESLIWGINGTLYLPKKYFIYNHFTNASSNGPVKITSCTEDDNSVLGPVAPCLHFDENTTVFVNSEEVEVVLEETTDCSCGLCCTTEDEDISCDFNRTELPPRSVCTCKRGCGSNNGVSSVKGMNVLKKLPEYVFGYFFVENILRNIF